MPDMETLPCGSRCLACAETQSFTLGFAPAITAELGTGRGTEHLGVIMPTLLTLWITSWGDPWGLQIVLWEPGCGIWLWKQSQRGALAPSFNMSAMGFERDWASLVDCFKDWMGGAMKAAFSGAWYIVGTGEVLFLSFLECCEGTGDWETQLGWRDGKGQFCLSACLESTGRSLEFFPHLHCREGCKGNSTSFWGCLRVEGT